MNTSNRRSLGLALFAISSVFAMTAAANAQLAITWYTIDGGGGTSTGGTFSLSGTIGQPDAGTLSGGTFVLQGGFWPGAVSTPACRPDYNQDGFLNTDDISDFVTDYFTQPPIPGPGGYALPCPGAPAPYDTLGYKVDVNSDCFVNTDDISDFVTAYFQGC